MISWPLATCPSPSPPLPSPPTYLLYSPSYPSSLHFSLCPLDSFRSLVPACFKKTAAGRQIFPELTPISYHAGEITKRERSRWEEKVGQAPFYKHTERQEVCICMCVCVCTCVYCMCVSVVPKRRIKQARNSLIYTSDKHLKTSNPWLMV